MTDARIDWRHRAACRDEPPELFFPVGASMPALVQKAKAKKVCTTCPVIEKCLEWALSSGVTHGVCGGLDQRERRDLLKRQHAEAELAEAAS